MAERPRKTLLSRPPPAADSVATTGTGHPPHPARGRLVRAPAVSPRVVPGSPATKVAATVVSAPPGGVRISKLMAERGLCSRRDADDYIARGWVFVDGRRVSELGTRADPGAAITLDTAAQTQQR